MIEESSDQNTKQESQDTMVETLANKVLYSTHAAETADTEGRSSSGRSVSIISLGGQDEELYAVATGLILDNLNFLESWHRIKYTQHAAAQQ